jgi:arabinofuranosyltransferase
MSLRRVLPGRFDPWALALLLFLGWYDATYARFAEPPAEDAAMLLRYSEHIAAGHGIVWNVGEKPLDGATDFLFMLAVALLRRIGFGLEAAARTLGLAAHVLTVLLVYAAIRTHYRAGPLPALCAAAYLAVGPGLHFVDIAFGTTFFALTVGLSVCAAQWLADAGPETVGRRALLFAVSGLLMGMARPEGVFLAVFFLAAVLLKRRGADLVPIVRTFALAFLTIGLAYFLWRWDYFGHPLPNPFYRKSGGTLHWPVVRKTFRNLALQGGPFLAVLGAGLFARSSRAAAVFGLLPVGLFGLLWTLVSDETVEYLRYSYAILPAVAIAWVPAAQALVGDRVERGRVRSAALAMMLTIAAAVLAVGLVVWQHRRFRHLTPARIGLYDVAVMLGEYRSKGYSMAVTEAGLLPLYSGWRAIDAWGLNDRYIARYGTVTEFYLDQYRPEVIMCHAYFSPGMPETGEKVERRTFGKPWYDMVIVLKTYAEKRGYRLAAVFGRHPYDTHYYYVRPGFPESDSIVRRIRETRYYWDGQPTVNYAASD